jgi:hypothetical protein
MDLPTFRLLAVFSMLLSFGGCGAPADPDASSGRRRMHEPPAPYNPPPDGGGSPEGGKKGVDEWDGGMGGAKGPATGDCATLTFAGDCPSSGQVRWCENGQPRTLTCDPGYTCQVNGCASGMADCCPATPAPPPAAPAPAGDCGAVPATGMCADAMTLRWCKAGQLVSTTCAPGTTCQAVGGAAQCVPQPGGGPHSN